MIIKAILLTSGAFGLVHGDVGGTQQSVKVGAAVRVSGDADAGTESDVQPFNLLTDRHPFDEFFGNLRRLLGKLQIQQRGEFIAAHARKNVERPQTCLQLLGNPAQHPIAGIVTE
ncbi:hypothetical protein D3C81_1182700 [compost metagenome]